MMHDLLLVSRFFVLPATVASEKSKMTSWNSEFNVSFDLYLVELECMWISHMLERQRERERIHLAKRSYRST